MEDIEYGNKIDKDDYVLFKGDIDWAGEETSNPVYNQVVWETKEAERKHKQLRSKYGLNETEG